MRKLILLHCDLRDLLRMKDALVVAIADETRDIRLDNMNALILEIEKVIGNSEHLGTDGYFRLTIDRVQGRILKAILPKILYRLHNQLKDHLI